jgi:dTDP-4-dehydrorhamnose reductase
VLLKEMIEELWIVRFTWMFGVPERNCCMSNGILWETMVKLMKREPIMASKREFRGMTYVYDMIEKFPKLFEIPYGTYHLGSQNNLSRYDIVKAILVQLGLDNKLDELLVEDTVKYRDKPRDVRLNTDKAQQLGIEFTDTLEAVGKCIQEFKLKLF